MNPEPLSLFVHWEGTCLLIFDICQSMPKSARHTFALRLEGGALDFHAHITEARYQSGATRGGALASADAQLSTLRFLARLAHHRQTISHGRLEELSRALDEAGRMLGGWRRGSGG
jgi:hypothetical protein